ncbi:MAG TPA: 2-oxo acid dehydrogenase subunit E2 [Bacteroidota bacterium]|nr:2-oxo acid dehydrogenase subunit E2 [Bacteroidota bacterium]
MDVRLPRLGEGADSGIVSTVFVKEGDRVVKDQPVLELESEKAVASIPAPAAGIVAKVFVKEGDELKVGALIISLSDNGGGPSRAEEAKPRIEATSRERMPEAAAIDVQVEEPPVREPAPPGAAQFPLVHPAGAPAPASPSLRKIARELGIDLHRVQGSERGGRIVMADLRSYVQKIQQIAQQERGAQRTTPAALPAKAPPARIDFSKWGSIQEKKLTLLRKAIAGKMVESWTSVPHVTQFDEADVTACLALRKKYAAKYEAKGGHLTLTTFVLRALTGVLKRHPTFNSSLDEAAGTLILKDYYHIGIAVDTPEGLIVPVLRNVDQKSMLDLSSELADLAEKTRQRKIALDQMQGGSFTVSNQGGIGSAHFTPIINTPEVAILGLGRGAIKAVLRDGKSAQRTMVPLALSYDHRVNDGADAARFMVDLVEALENFNEADVRI